LADLSPLVVLGVTGSIGGQTLDVARRLDIPVAAVAARRGSQELLDIAAELPAALIGVAAPTGSEREALAAALGGRVRFGPESLEEFAALQGATVVNGVVGAAGLPASVAALLAGNRLALANKESLVAGGPVIDKARTDGGGELIPVDSEHSALFQCLVGEDPEAIARLILTASGGPFRGKSPEELEAVTVEDALAHPTWDMGPRITIDSATLMNKAFEVIEAHYLFGLGYDQIDVVIHPQSIVHSFVEFIDGVVKAEVGDPDMRKPIQYAITAPDRVRTDHRSFNPVGVDLTFESPDRSAFPCLELGYEAGRIGGTATAVLNAADEVAVEAFLGGQISFTDIAAVVGEVLSTHTAFMPEDIEALRAVDTEARAQASEACERIAR